MKKITGELIKIIKMPVVYISTIAVFFFDLLLFLWLAYISGGEIRQTILQNADKASYFSLAMFAVIFRKIWAIIIGCESIGGEMESNSNDFSIQNQGKCGLFFHKCIGIGIFSLILIIFICFAPFVVDLILTGSISSDFNMGTLIDQMALVYLMTVGSALLAMFFVQITKKTIPIIVIFLVFEFFGQFFPFGIIDVWNKTDGYWYFSNLLLPLKENLSQMKNFSFSLSTAFDGYQGFLIWIILMVLLIGVAGYVTYKKE